MLGLARPNTSMMLSPYSSSVQTEGILANGTFPEDSFSTRFTGGGVISWIDFGAPDAGQQKRGNTTISTIEDYFWSVPL